MRMPAAWPQPITSITQMWKLRLSMAATELSVPWLEPILKAPSASLDFLIQNSGR